MVCNGKPTCKWFYEEESENHKVATETLFHTMSTDAKENGDVMTADAPNAFTQTDTPNGDDKIAMNIAGVPVQMSVEDSPQVYENCVAHKNDKKALHVEVK